MQAAYQSKGKTGEGHHAGNVQKEQDKRLPGYGPREHSSPRRFQQYENASECKPYRKGKQQTLCDLHGGVCRLDQSFLTGQKL
jgi:hypothetical protein